MNPRDASGAIISSPKKARPEFPQVSVLDSVRLNVQAIRLASEIGSTQETFAAAIGVPVKTLRNWEQGRRKRP